MNLKNQILVALGLDKSINLEWQSKLEDGTLVVSTADTLESGSDVSILTEDGTTIPLPIGSYLTEDGVTFVVTEEGIVDSVSESETEEVVEAAEDEDCPNGYDDDGKCKEEEKTEAAEIGDWEKLEERIQNLEDAVAKLKEDKVGGDTEMADEETTEEVVEEVIEAVEAAVEDIAAAIDEATPEEVTPELATQAAEIAIEVLQEKATEVVDGATELERKKAKSKAKLAKLKKENKRLKAELAESPAEAPINTNKFSSERATPTAQDLRRMTKQEKYLYNLYR